MPDALQGDRDGWRQGVLGAVKRVRALAVVRLMKMDDIWAGWLAPAPCDNRLVAAPFLMPNSWSYVEREIIGVENN